jgi:hypothetical protein
LDTLHPEQQHLFWADTTHIHTPNLLDEYFESHLLRRTDRRFVDFMCDSGIIRGVSFLHEAITNPSCLDDGILLEPQKNVNSARDYCMPFQEVHNQLRQDECELYGIVCDNLQAKVNGVEQFILDHEDMATLVMPVPGCNHLVNLVFRYSLRTECLSQMKWNFEGII